MARVGTDISQFEETLGGSASPKDLETLFQLIYLNFTAPRADPAYFEAFKTQMETVLENRGVNPATAFSDAVSRLLTQDHPRRRPPTVESLELADLEESFAFYKDRFADASDFSFIFVGTIDMAEFRPLVEQYIGGLPSIDRDENWRDVGIRYPTGVIEETVNRGTEPQSRTSIVFTGSFPFDDQNQRTGIRAMVTVLQSRLRDLLREELGGTYSVSVNASYVHRPLQQYRITIGFGSDPERADELTRTIFEEIEKLKASGPAEDEVADVKEGMRRSLETNLEQNSYWLGQLAFAYQRGVDPGASLLSAPASIEALTASLIHDAARRYFDTDNYVRVTLLPTR